ncbi:MAG: hypothetical protein ACREIB_10840, partial [Pseudomonadota bacterium]
MRGDRLPPGSFGLSPGSFRDVPQIGFEFGFGRSKHARRLALADQGKQGFVAPDLAREATVACRLARLPLEALGLGIDLPQNIVEANEIVRRRLETQLGFVAAGMEPRDARGFLDDPAALLRLGGNDLADLALPHHGWRTRAGR